MKVPRVAEAGGVAGIREQDNVAVRVHANGRGRGGGKGVMRDKAHAKQHNECDHRDRC